MARAVSAAPRVTASEAVHTVIALADLGRRVRHGAHDRVVLEPRAELLRIDAPATIESTSASGRITLSPLMTVVSLCGLIDNTTTSAWAAASALSVKGRTPYLSLSCSTLSARGPAASRCSGSASFSRMSPPIIASAITPGPMNAIVCLGMPGIIRPPAAVCQPRASPCTSPARNLRAGVLYEGESSIVFFYRCVPRFLGGARHALPLLPKIERELQLCSGAGAAAALADGYRAAVCARLRDRFAPEVAQALTLKVLNILLAGYHLRARDVSVSSRPFGIVLDPSNVCRLACPGCVHSTRSEALGLFDWPNGTLRGQRFAELLSLYGPYGIGMYFCNYGEPLLNTGTPKLIRSAKNHLLWTSLSTSLSVLRFDAEAYVRSGLDFMVLSIDGATQPVYGRYRRNGDLELVLRNVRSLVSARRDLGRGTPVLSWNFLAFEHNVHEIPAAERMARRLGVDQFRVVRPFDVSWDDPEVRPAAVTPRVTRLRWFSTSNPAANWNPFPDSVDAGAIARAFEAGWEAPGKDGAPPATRSGHTCHWLYENIVLDAAGRVLPCCAAPRPDANLVFTTFTGEGDPFNSARHRQARSSFAGTPSPAADAAGAPYCTRCNWDHTTVNIGTPEIRRYFRAAGIGDGPG